jgi:hypothetical protein
MGFEILVRNASTESMRPGVGVVALLKAGAGEGAKTAQATSGIPDARKKLS